MQKTNWCCVGECVNAETRTPNTSTHKQTLKKHTSSISAHFLIYHFHTIILYLHFLLFLLPLSRRSNLLLIIPRWMSMILSKASCVVNIILYQDQLFIGTFQATYIGKRFGAVCFRPETTESSYFQGVAYQTCQLGPRFCRLKSPQVAREISTR